MNSSQGGVRSGETQERAPPTGSPGHPHILLISCPDRAGLVHLITGALYRNNLNIVVNHEFVDKETKHFYMRTEFAGTFDPQRLLRELYAGLPVPYIRLSGKKCKKIVVLVTREEHCLGDLLLRHEYGRLNAEILAVVSNHADLAPLVQKFGIEFFHVPHGTLDRQHHEAGILSVIDPLAPDFVILAKYMRILSPRFIEQYANRIINIHHSFLPAFKGAMPYQQAFDRGVKIIGATAHFATADLDEGPIIEQSVLPVNHSHSAEEMRQAGKDVENLVLASALRLAFDDRIFIAGNKTVIFT